jgi:hypothetical protein
MYLPYICLNKNKETMTQCTKCSAHIKNVIIIDNQPYGTECATTVLGINSLPYWFKGGNWNEAKDKYDADCVNQKQSQKETLLKMDEYWGEWVMLSKISRRAYSMQNDWLYSFMTSIINQLGYPNALVTTEFNTATEAFDNWKPYNGTFPMIYNQPKRISELSE